MRKLFALFSAAALTAATGLLSPQAGRAADAYLIGGLGYEFVAFDGFTYDLDGNVLGRHAGLYTDTTALGDPSNVYPAAFTPRVTLYFDGTHLSSAWDGEANLVPPGSVGGITNTSPTGELVDTKRRTTSSDILYLKGLDSEGIFTFANPGAAVDRALGFNVLSGARFTFDLNTTGYAPTTLQFTAAMVTGASARIDWSYSIDGATLVPTGLSSVVSGTLATVYTVDLSALSATLENKGSVYLVGVFNGSTGATVYLDHTAFIGTVAGVTTNVAPSISVGAPPAGTVGTPYALPFTVGGSPAPTLALTAGTKPPGLDLAGNSLAGTPTAGGLFSGLVVTATNGVGQPASTAPFSITINGPATLAGAPAAGTVGAAYSHNFTVGGYPAPTSVTLQSGALPPGLSLSGTTLGGTPTTAGSYTYTVAATNASGTATLPVTHTVNALPTIAAPASLTAVQGAAYSGTFTLGGTPAPTTVTLQSGTLPPGLSLGGATLAGTPTAAGTYNFTVATTNTAGTATLPVAFTVQSVPVVTLPTGNAVQFATLTPATAEIFADGLPAPTLTMTGAPAWLSLTTSTNAATGRTTGTLAGTPPIGAPASITVDFHATNAAGTATVRTLAIGILATTTAPSITTQPVGGNVALHGAFTFTVAAAGVPTPTYQWRKDGTALAGATASSFTVTAAAAGDAGAYDVVVTNNTGTATSSAATLVVLVPVTITAPPVSAAVGVGDPVNLSVSATGLAPLTYQWRKDGVAIGGATAATFSIASATLASAGAYDVVVTNPAGSVTSAAATVAVDSPPTITEQPVGGTFVAGHAITLTVAATSVSTPTHQWRKNGAAIAGATAATFTLADPTETDSGRYDAVVTNVRGSVTSAPADLVFVAVPQFIAAPASVLAVAGSAVSFTVTATPASAQFQWYRDGLAVDGATTNRLDLFDVGPDEARAAFTCRLTNFAGTVTSAPAHVVVWSPASRVLPLTGGAGELEVVAPAAFDAWTVVSDASWLVPQRSGAKVAYTVGAAPGGQPRVGRLTVTVPGLGALTHEVAQREFVVLSAGFADGLADWAALGTNAPAVVTELSGRRDVLALGPVATPNAGAAATMNFAAVRSRAALAATTDRRAQTDVFLAVNQAGAGHAEAFLALLDPSATAADAITPTATEPTSNLRVALWHAGADADARLRGHTWLSARFLAADGKFRALDLATAVPADELAGKWVRLAADVGADGKVSVWVDPEPFGDPVRVWSSSVAAHPKLRTEQSLLLGLRAGGAANRPYQSAPVVSAGFAPRDVANRLLGLSTRVWTGNGEQVAIAGLATSGGPAQLLVRGLGPMLARFAVPGTLPNPRLVGYDGRAPAYVLRVQDAWEQQRLEADIAAISDAERPLGLFPLEAGAPDAAFLYRSVDTGEKALRTVHLKSADGTATGQGLIELYALNRTSGGQLVAISTRALVPKGVAMIPGLAVEGNATRLFLVRGVGPALAQHGIAQPLAAPRLELYRGGSHLATNTKWGTAAAASLLPEAATRTGATALTAGSADSAVLVRLWPGSFTVPITAADGGEGVALAEIYALPADADLDTAVE